MDQILRASRIRTILNMPEWQDSIGKWIEDGKKEGVHKMANAQTEREFFSSQGFYNAFDKITTQIEVIMAEEAAAIERERKKKQREINGN